MNRIWLIRRASLQRKVSSLAWFSMRCKASAAAAELRQSQAELPPEEVLKVVFVMIAAAGGDGPDRASRFAEQTFDLFKADALDFLLD